MSRSPRRCFILLFLATLAAVFTVLGPGTASAGPNAGARIAIHLQPVEPGGACTRSSAQPPCEGVEPTGHTQPDEYFAYVLVMKGNAAAGIAGVQFGIEYDGVAERGVDVFHWVTCGALQFASPGWPAPGTGTIVTWDSRMDCERTEPGGPGTGVVAVAGYFYMGAYTPDVLRITPRPVDDAAKVADCDAIEDLLEGSGVHHDPSLLGSATFSTDGSLPGYNPCDAIPATIDCAISGPSFVPAGTGGLFYGAPNAPAGASYAWSVSGSGSITGPSTGATVEVQAGTGASFQVAVSITASGESNTCTKNVSIFAPTCGFSGPSSVDSGTGNAYSVSGTASGTPAWSISGNGTIGGPANGPTVNVTAGDPGTFTLFLDLTGPGGTVSCQKTVTVQALSCGITGPDPVTEGTPQIVYAPQTNVPGAGFGWSITGDGEIVSVTPNHEAVVNAGGPGSFELRLEVTPLSGPPVVCLKTVVVDSMVCSIQGPASVPEQALNITYSAGPALIGAAYAWSIAGNGSLPGPVNEANVPVNTGVAGTFDLTVTITRSGGSVTCARTISVTAPCQPGANGQAKILVHLSSITAKNPCGRRPACNSIVSSGGLYPPNLYYAYVLVADGNAAAGVGGVELGLGYNELTGQGVDVFGWSPCGGTHAPVNGWPSPGGGNRITWSTCQHDEPLGAGTGVVASAGYFYLGAYTADNLSSELHPQTGTARVFDCEGCESIIAPSESPPLALGFAAFSSSGTSPGYNPCGEFSLPVVPTTWSAIKNLYAPGRR